MAPSRILIVDDDQGPGRLLEIVFTRHGYERRILTSCWWISTCLSRVEVSRDVYHSGLAGERHRPSGQRMSPRRSRKSTPPDRSSGGGVSARASHSIGYLCRRTGLTPHVIRVWERRYGAIRPERTAKGRRTYTDSDLLRLERLAEATRHGHRIGDIASLDDRELDSLAHGSRRFPAEGASDEIAMRGFVESFDGDSIRVALEGRLAQGSALVFIQDVALPLIRELGERWSRGEITAAHEHFVTQVIREVLCRMPARHPAAGAPSVVLATPPGQHHEMGAFMASRVAREIGWKVCYLGPCLPLVEVACAVRSIRARAVVLGLTHPADDPVVLEEIEHLLAHIPPGVTCLAGGAALSTYGDRLAALGVKVCRDLADLRDQLLEIGESERDVSRGGGAP